MYYVLVVMMVVMRMVLWYGRGRQYSGLWKGGDKEKERGRCRMRKIIVRRVSMMQVRGVLVLWQEEGCIAGLEGRSEI